MQQVVLFWPCRGLEEGVSALVALPTPCKRWWRDLAEALWGCRTALQVQDLDQPAIIRIIDIISIMHIIAIIDIIGTIYILGQGLRFGVAILCMMNINSIIYIIYIGIIGIIGIICITFSAWVSVFNAINQKMWSIK